MSRVLAFVACVTLAGCGSRPAPTTVRFEPNRIVDGSGRIVRMKRSARLGWEDEILRYDSAGRVRERIMRAARYSHEHGCVEWSTVITEEGPRCERTGVLPLPPERIEVIDTYRYDHARRPIARHRRAWRINDDFFTDPPGSPGIRSATGSEDVVWTWQGEHPTGVTVTLEGHAPVRLDAAVVAAPYVDEAEHIRDLSAAASRTSRRREQ